MEKVLNQTWPNNYNDKRHWMVIMDNPQLELTTKPQIVDYYVKTLERVFEGGYVSESPKQMILFY